MVRMQNDDIDITTFFKTLWNGKWIICVFTVLGFLLGVSYYLVKKPVYESTLTFSIDNIPPYFLIEGKPDLHKVFSDFQKLFFAAKIFEDWKTINTNALIKFEDFSKTKTFNGTIIQQNKGTLKITFENKNKNDFFVLIKSKDLKFLDNVYNYITYINNLLNSSYKLESINALSIIKKDLILLSKLEKSKIDYMTIKIYLMKTENGSKPFIIDRPTMPLKISPNLYFILNLSIFLGGIIGCIYIVARNVFHNNKN